MRLIDFLFGAMVGLVLVLILAIVMAPAPASQDWSSTVATVSQGVHLLTGYERNAADEIEPYYCTAILVSKDTYVTAAHCVKKEEPRVTINGLDADPVRVNTTLDLAMYSVFGAKGTVVQLRAVKAAPGLPVAIIGYALGSEQLKPTFGWISDVRDTVVERTGMFMDVAIHEGHSGGAVVDVDGRLITIGQQAIGERAYFAFGVSQEAFRTFVEGYLYSLVKR